MLRISSLMVCVLLITVNAWSQGNYWTRTNGPGVGQDVRSLTSNSQGTLFAGTWTAGEVFKTTDDGNTWSKCGAIPNTNPVLGLAVDQHDYIFASVFLRGVARSTDNGATWEMFSAGLTNLTPRGIIVDKQNNVWVATEGGLFVSTNEGQSWTNSKPGFFGCPFMDSTYAIITGSTDSLHRSTNGGVSWTNTPLSKCLFFGIHADGSYYGWTPSAQMFRSTDFGATWTDLHSPVSWSLGLASGTFTRSGEVFFSEAGYGVLHSSNNGETWQVVNSGLTTDQVTSLYAHPNGYVYAATAGYGIFRTSEPSGPPQNITVSLPQIVTAAGNGVEIPVSVTSLSGWGILSFEFTLKFNSPDSILTFDPVAVTAGTLSGANGWSVQVNTTVPNQVTVGGYGATPLLGQGVLLKLKARTLSGAAAGDSTGLVLDGFTFNTGSPEHATINGGVVIHERVCGDADENGSVQAYDAALTLREALGPMSPPPAPLTAMGRINADVNMDGKVQAYDAALILRHVIGLAMPESTANCFSESVAGTPRNLALTGHIDSKQYVGGKWSVQMHLTGVPADFPVISYAFELTAPAYLNDNVSLTLPQLAQGYLATVNLLDNGHFRVGIINPNGVDVENIPLTLTANYYTSLNAVTLSDLFLNDAANDTVRLSNIFTSVGEPTKPATPQSYDLLGAYPNPFNPLTRIVFQIPVSGLVRLEVYNLQGIKIKTLRNEQMASGRHEIFWDGTNSIGQNVSTGEYFCVMRAESFTKTIRLLLVK